jgi:AraC family transcriptional regulator, melibiose operon regulatory protein
MRRKPHVDHVTLGFKCWKGVPSAMKGFHRHSEIEVNFVERGSMTYLHGGKQAVIGAGQVGFFWAAVPHQLTGVEKPVTCHWITLPLAWFLHWQLPDMLTRPILHGDMVVDSELNRELDLLQFDRWPADLATDHAERRKITLLEIEARFRRAALRCANSPRKAETRAPTPSAGALGKVELMARHIAENYSRELHTAEIAAAAGLHPNYAMVLFRRTFGVTLMDYLMQQRISHAQRLLATTDDKILNIAHESGFNSLSRFYAAFMRICTQSPRKYRASMQRES